MNHITVRGSSPFGGRRLWGDDFDQAFAEFFRPVRSVEEATSENLTPTMDIAERVNDYVVRTDLPGVKKEDIQVTMENGVLTVSAESKSETEQKDGERLLRQERRYGKFTRSLRLGSQVDDKKVRANYKDGVLELILPKAEEIKPKKIAVDVG